MYMQAWHDPLSSVCATAPAWMLSFRKRPACPSQLAFALLFRWSPFWSPRFSRVPGPNHRFMVLCNTSAQDGACRLNGGTELTLHLMEGGRIGVVHVLEELLQLE